MKPLVSRHSLSPFCVGRILPLLPTRVRQTLPVFWLERLPQLLDLSVTLEASPMAAVVSPAATAEPDYTIWENAGKISMASLDIGCQCIILTT
jgi:hypothetical protein